MALDIRVGDRVARVNLKSMEGSHAIIEVDGVTYDVDVVMVEEGVYSIIHKGHSYNIEMIPGNGPKNYFVNTFDSSLELEIIDAQSRYQQSRNRDSIAGAEKIISTPMPGKVVRIPVVEGDSVEKGTTVIVISAMKMESEYKAPIAGTVKRIFVQEGDTIASNQPLVELE